MAPDPSEKLLPGPSLPQIKIEKASISNSVGQSEDFASSPAGLQLLDFLFGTLVVAPLVVGVWRGCWGLMDLHAQFFPPAQSFVLGMVIHICFALIRSHLLARSTGARSGSHGSGARWGFERALSRLYTIVFALACILQWRGGWGLLDAAIEAVLGSYKSRRPTAVACAALGLVCGASALRATRNLLASPYFIVTDGKEPTYIFTTRFRKDSGRDTALYVLDCVFSVGVVGSLVVFLWRGLWTLMDIFLYPGDPSTSNWASLVIGYVLVSVTFSLQAPARWACARLHGAPRLLLADLFHLLSFVATVNVWRGYWGLLEMYFLPDSPYLSNWICHTCSLTLLMLLNCSNSVLVRGVYIDAEEPAGECVVFPCHYLRLFFHRERTKKRHRRALLAAAAASARKSEDACVEPLAPLAPLASLSQEKV